MPNPKALPETHQDPKSSPTSHGQKTPSISLYEQTRQDRIKENLQRMQKLGILDLSDKLKSRVRPKRAHNKRSPSDSQSLLASAPPRRSSRLQNVTPVSYSEQLGSKEDNHVKNNIRVEVGSKPEVYTEEHEKLLGNTERSWTLFVDGYGQDGKRIYDPVKGKTCHQCRQKTLGRRTQCSKCNMVQGQFCGDCLYMRYGEHVLEANENPDWICPPCRGICNCSLCRQAKGWCPTGTLYKKISRLGFKSVAHYLIQTRRAETNLEKTPDIVNQVSVKRSLSFKEKESSKIDDIDRLGESKLSEDQKDNNDLTTEEHKLHTATKRALPFSYIETESEIDSTEVDIKVLNHFELSKPQLEGQRDGGVKDEQEKGLHNTDDGIAEKKRAAIGPSPDSIAGRLRQRRRKVDDLDNMEITAVNDKRLDVELPVGNNLSEKELENVKITSTCNGELGHKNHAADVEDTAGRHGENEDLNKERLAGAETTTMDTKEPGPDSIARRLRPRSKTT